MTAFYSGPVCPADTKHTGILKKIVRNGEIRDVGAEKKELKNYTFFSR